MVWEEAPPFLKDAVKNGKVPVGERFIVRYGAKVAGGGEAKKGARRKSSSGRGNSIKSWFFLTSDGAVVFLSGRLFCSPPPVSALLGSLLAFPVKTPVSNIYIYTH